MGSNPWVGRWRRRNSRYFAGRNINWYSHRGKLFGGSSKKPDTELPHDPASHTKEWITVAGYSDVPGSLTAQAPVGGSADLGN